MEKLTEMYLKMQAKLQDEKGATMVEYGLMVALIAVVVAVAVGPLGTAVAAKFTAAATSVGAP